MPIALAFTAAATKTEFRTSERRRPAGIPRISGAVSSPALADTASRLIEQDRRLAAWMKAAQAGDRNAYESLLRASIPFIKMVARKQGVSPDFVEDVVQDTLLTVHRIRQSYDPARPFAAWLRTIAQRRAIDIMRSRGRTSSREIYEPLTIESLPDPTGTPEDQADQTDCRSLLGAAVASLPARQREAVEQLALKGRSLVDAAVAIGLTPGALKVNFHRAINNLRQQFSADKKPSARAASRRPIRVATAAANGPGNFEHALVKCEM